MRGLCLVLVSVFTGCSTLPKPGTALISHSPSEKKSIALSVPHSGTYWLMRGKPDAPESPEPIQTATVERRKAIGFGYNSQGDFTGQFHQTEFPLAEGDYFWTLAPGSELQGAGLFAYRSREAVVETLGVVIGIPVMFILMATGRGWG
jgi:hypothetical protein